MGFGVVTPSKSVQESPAKCLWTSIACSSIDREGWRICKQCTYVLISTLVYRNYTEEQNTDVTRTYTHVFPTPLCFYLSKVASW